jgi:hypothetical protein
LPSWGDTSPPNFLYREAFHHVQICLANPVLGGGGIAEIGGRSFAMSFPEMNADPADDLTEEGAFDLYAEVALGMGTSVPSDPNSGAPPAFRFKGKDRPTRVP